MLSYTLGHLFKPYKSRSRHDNSWQGKSLVGRLRTRNEAAGKAFLLPAANRYKKCLAYLGPD